MTIFVFCAASPIIDAQKVVSISLWAPLITVRKKSECFHLHIKGLLQNHRNTLSSMTPNMFQFTASYRMISKTLLVIYLLSHMSISLVSHRLILRDLEDVFFLYVMVFRTIKNTCKAAKLWQNYTISSAFLKMPWFDHSKCVLSIPVIHFERYKKSLLLHHLGWAVF